MKSWTMQQFTEYLLRSTIGLILLYVCFILFIALLVQSIKIQLFFWKKDEKIKNKNSSIIIFQDFYSIISKFVINIQKEIIQFWNQNNKYEKSKYRDILVLLIIKKEQIKKLNLLRQIHNFDYENLQIENKFISSILQQLVETKDYFKTKLTNSK